MTTIDPTCFIEQETERLGKIEEDTPLENLLLKDFLRQLFAAA
jgi:hypothetical protein